MKVNLNGPSYKHPSVDVNPQRSINLYPISAGPEGRGGTAMVRTNGLLELTSLGTDPVRCMGMFGRDLYVVVGRKVIEVKINYISKAFTTKEVGTLQTSTGIVHMATNPTQVMIVDGSKVGYVYTPSIDEFYLIPESTFPGGSSVVFIDSYFVVSEPDTGKFYFSGLNDGKAWDPLDVATAETNTDNIVGLGVTKGELWVIGEFSTEIWYNAANATGSPFSLRTGLQMQVGCLARDSIVEVNDLLVWLDHRGFIVQSAVSPFVRSNNSGYDMQVISDEAMTAEIQKYSRLDDAIAMSYNDRGHIMYQITFPTAGKTWVYDYLTKVWHERSYLNFASGKEEAHLGQFYARIETLQLMGGLRDGKIYISSSDYYTDNGAPIRCARISSCQYDTEQFNLAEVARIDLRVGISTHNVQSPKITLRYSNNGGHTWSHHLIRNLGNTGEYARLVTWNRLGTAREWVFELVVTDPIDFTIIEAVAIVELER